MEIVKDALHRFDRLSDHDAPKVQDLRSLVLKTLHDNNLARNKSTFVDYGYVDEVLNNGFFYEEYDPTSHRRVRFERGADEDRTRIMIQDTHTGEISSGSVTGSIVPGVLNRSAEKIAQSLQGLIKSRF